jgi:hypothetical protein
MKAVVYFNYGSPETQQILGNFFGESTNGLSGTFFREATGLTQGLLNRIAEFLIDLLDRSRGKLLRWLFPAIHAPSEHQVSLVLAEDR